MFSFAGSLIQAALGTLVPYLWGNRRGFLQRDKIAISRNR